MFRGIVKETPFTSREANDYFDNNIYGEALLGDWSFLATLRALVAPRMDDGDKLSICMKSVAYTMEQLNNVNKKTAMNAVYNPSHYADGSIVVLCLTSDQNGASEHLKMIEDNFLKCNPNFERVEKVTDFYRKTFRCLCYIDRETRKVALFTEIITIRRLHYLQCSILAFLPWYFDPKDGVSEDEMELILSLRETDVDRYYKALEKLASKYNFRDDRIKALLTGFESVFERNKLDRIRALNDDIMASIHRYQSSISDLLKEKRNNDINLLGLETKLAEGNSDDSEIMEYFMCNKKLILENVQGTTMTFTVRDYITYFDEDMAKNVIENQNSYVYLPGGICGKNIANPSDVKRLMIEIFIKQTLKIKTCATYTLMLGERVSPYINYPYGMECSDCLPNPHINEYRCLGNYERTIYERITENDPIGAIEQCVASCKSLNFADSVVMNEFMRLLYGTNCQQSRCIELPKGDMVDMKTAIAWMKENDNRNETEE